MNKPWRAACIAPHINHSDIHFTLCYLCARVPLYKKELAHLIQCGALDGLGPNRTTLLAQAEQTPQVASTHAPDPQLAFDFGPDAAPVPEPESELIEAESRAQRLAWESAILGRPVSVHPLEALEEIPSDLLRLDDAAARMGERVRVAAYRLPGGPGCFVGDGHTFCTAILPKRIRSLSPWESLRLTGRWTQDEWGSPWFQIDEVVRLTL